MYAMYLFIYFSLLSKSYIENLQKLVKGSKDDLGLSAINGIKAISMILIIAGHALVFMIGGPVLNADFYAKVNALSSVYQIILLIVYYHSDLFEFTGNKIGTKCIFS